MNRLKKDIDHIVSDGIDSEALYKRVCRYLRELARYRDTGLEPEEIMSLCEMEKRSRLAKMLRWEEAERAGRLVVLPCKVGDTVYQTDGLKVYESKIQRLIYETAGIAFEESALGQCVFLTREEAEAALEVKKDGPGSAHH